jgi:hypothetical protein
MSQRDRDVAEMTLINTNIRTYLALMNRKVIAGRHHHSEISINVGNSPEHEALKTKTAHQLLRQGHTIITEGILKTGARPDIIVLDVTPPEIYEIIISETEEHALEKKERYMQIPIHIVKKKEATP